MVQKLFYFFDKIGLKTAKGEPGKKPSEESSYLSFISRHKIEDRIYRKKCEKNTCQL